MSVNQSRGDKNEPSQYRRSGRSGNQASPRNFSGGGGGGKGGGGGGSTTAPPSSAFHSGKSFKKVVSNAQGPQTRVTGPNPNVNLGTSNSSAGGRAAPNGAHMQPPLRGTPDASSTVAPVKPTDPSVQKTPGLPKAPQSNVGPHSSGTTGPATPVKGSGDASRAFPLQFGSISPGVMNGMQVPARTNSAPPNMDEQKRAQARLESLKAAAFQNQNQNQNPTGPNQHLPRKDAGSGPVDQPIASEARPTSKDKKDILPSAPQIPAHIHRPTGPPMPSIPMQIPFHQSQIRLPFGGPNPQPNTSLPVPLPMHLPVGNPPQVGPQVYIPGIQHHQGIIHQSQGLTFSPQIGNMGMGLGMGLGPQYQQQQPMGNLNFVGNARRAVKITHPDTHEELKLGNRADGHTNSGSTGQRLHPHGPPQSQVVQSFPTAQPMNYYPNSYNPSPIYYPPPGTQNNPGSQAPRFYNQASKQVTVKPAAEKVNDSSSPAVNITEIPKSQRAGGEGTSGQPNKDSKTTVGTQSEILTVTSTVAVGDSKSVVNSAPEVAPVNKSESVGGQSSSVSSSTVGYHGPVESDVQKTSAPVEISNKAVSSNVADVSSNPIITSQTHSDNSPKVEGPISEIVEPKEQVRDSVELNQDITVSVLPVEEQKEPINNNEDNGDQVSNLDVDQVNNQEQPLTVNEESPAVAVSVSVPETPSLTFEVESTGSISPSSSKSKGNNNHNNNTAKGKKKIKEILKNADARGTTSDLYNAYKQPEEKKEALPETVENPSVISSEKDVLTNERNGPGPAKFEPEDWEDAADVSGPKMETNLKHDSEDDNDGIAKKYSRDFLLKFSDQFMDLPEGFEISPEITEVFIGSGGNTGRDPYPSPGRGGGDRVDRADRAAAGSRLDRRPSNVGLDEKWNKGSAQPGWDPRVNHGVLRTPRGQPPGQHTGGILSGPMQSPGPRNNSDSDRWQRATGYQKGLMPSPHNAPMMHKAERKYEVGKITDEEQAKQRQLKGILNKLTPQNFEKLFDQVKQVNIDNANTLSGVIDQIFDKALMEPTFVEMYANFCSRLSAELPDFSENNEKITFKRLLLNKCQEEFERGEREQEEANRTEEDGEIKQTEEEREEKRVKARRRMLGNIRLIGELYKKKMLTERIMHACINKLLGQYQNPDEEDIEALCKLMSTIGEMIDHPKAKEFMDAYFSMMFKLSNNMELSSRVRFMLKDAIDLRKNKWQQRRKVEGPKKIDEVHRDAANERQAISNRLARGPNPSTPVRRDFGPKGSNVLQSSPQTGGYGYNRGPPQQGRGYGNQDSRFDSFENRTLSVPLRPMGDESITLGPQGGLARGMSVRGQGQPSSMQLHDMDSRRGVVGPNGYGPRDDLGSRYTPDRFSPRPVYDPNPSNAGRGFERAPLSSRPERARVSLPPERARVSTPPQSGRPSDKVLSEDRLRDMSIEAIKEFYSARDEKEVALCIKDLNAPSFYPEMISIWVTDSFERKDNDRDSLAKLLINLTKSQDQILSQDSLVKGFESVLSTLEDALNDAPKAAEFLGRIFAKILLENVIPYTEAFRLIYEGGEEQGSLVKFGLAAEVLGVILEIIQSEKGDPFLKDVRTGSSYRFDNFRPPNMKKVSRLDKFI